MADDEIRYDHIPTFDGLKGLNLRGLRDRYDVAARASSHTPASFFLDEIHRRESRRREWFMVGLTALILVLTVVNVVYVARANTGSGSRYHEWPRSQHHPRAFP